MSSGFLLSAILLHVVVFLMVATWIIFPSPAELPDASFLPVNVKPPPPPPPAPPAAAGGGSTNPLEPQPEITPPSSTASIVHTETPADFTVNAAAVASPSLPESFTEVAAPSLGDKGAPGLLDLGAGSSPFGSSEASQQSLAGTFYDLKQTPNHKPTKIDAKAEQEILKDFFAKGWNEAGFKKSYLSSRKPIYCNELIIPFQYSIIGPAAFGMQNECKPGYWAVIYHVKINATRSGDFSLAGFGDDFLVARVNGVNVLDSGYFPPVTTCQRIKSFAHGPWLNDAENSKSTTYGNAVVGDRFHINAGDDFTLDVLIGDADAAGGRGRCGYFLFLVQDRDYPKDDQGNYILPLLQIHPDLDVKRDGEYPPFTCRSEDALTGS